MDAMKTGALAASVESEPLSMERGEPLARIPDIAQVFLAVFALAWAVARAHLQAITGDEGDSFLLWAAAPNPSHWLPSPNNHILNSILMRLVTTVFGVSSLSVRTPALLGAALYIAVAFWLSRLITAKWPIRLLVFVCLVYNPYVSDYYAAARGYALSTALLLAAMAVPAWYYLKLAKNPGTLIAACAITSLSLALSFTANFAMAFVQAVALVVLVFWALGEAEQCGTAETRRLKWRVLGALLLPGALVVVLVPSWTLLHWQPGFLFAGAKSLLDTLSSVADASVYQVNPQLANPIVFAVLNAIQPFLIPVICALAALQVVLILIERRRRDDEYTGKLLLLSAVSFGVVGISLLLHQIAYWALGLLMPVNRTALFVAPLCTLAIGIIAAIVPVSRAARTCRTALLTTLSVAGLYFLTCLRLTHFKEWQYQEDVKRAYDVVAWYNHNRGVQDVETSWYYYGALSYYRQVSGAGTLAPFTTAVNRPHALDKQLYVLNIAFEHDFIDANKLHIVYRGPHSDVVVAIPDAPEKAK